jgi:hypothetical protein
LFVCSRGGLSVGGLFVCLRLLLCAKPAQVAMGHIGGLSLQARESPRTGSGGKKGFSAQGIISPSESQCRLDCRLQVPIFRNKSRDIPE